MQCLRCNSKLKHYNFNATFRILGSPDKANILSNSTQVNHNPHSVYVCDNCGYMEFSTKPCEKPDV